MAVTWTSGSPPGFAVYTQDAESTASTSANKVRRNRVASQTGGSGTRQFGSHRACQSTTTRVHSTSAPTIEAIQDQPVNSATNPISTAVFSNGTTTRFADRPEIDRRWKY